MFNFIGKLFGWERISSISDSVATNLKLEAQKIKEFLGKYDDWPKWKNRTQCAFDGSGYERILQDRRFADRNPKMNRIVYSQLAVATVDGTAYHLIKQFEDSKDGHAAWQALIEWFDGDVIKNETAESLRTKLEKLKLTRSLKAEDYINKYLTWMSELDRIKGEKYSDSHKVHLFLRNIEDSDFGTTVEILRKQNSTLEECVTTVRKTQRDVAEKRSRDRKESKLRRVKDKDNSDGKSPKKSKRWNGEFQVTEKGLISIPRDDWVNTLTDDEKSFVQNYNSRIKHGESIDDLTPPKGTTIKTKSRRMVTPDLDQPEGHSPKRISFNLQHENDEDDDKEDDEE